MRSVIVDSSAFLSLEDRDEYAHAATRDAFRGLVSEHVPLLTTNFVFDETYTLILSRLGRRRAVDWGHGFRSSKLIEIVRVDEEHEQAAWQLILTFSDKNFSYTDATTFAICRAFGIEEALSRDGHLRQYGALSVLP